MKKTAIYLLMAVIAALSVGCNKTDNPEPTLTIINVVTYVSTTADGSVSTFTFTDAKGDLITLSANWKAPEAVKPGQRMLLTYSAEQYGVSGPVNLISIMPVPGGAISLGEPSASSWPLQNVAVTRSGDYIDLRAVISFAGNAGEISLYAPEPEAAEPRLYVVVTPEPDAPVTEAAPRTLYASWDLGSVEGLAEKQTLHVVYTPVSGKEQTVTLTSEN